MCGFAGSVIRTGAADCCAATSSGLEGLCWDMVSYFFECGCCFGEMCSRDVQGGIVFVERSTKSWCRYLMLLCLISRGKGLMFFIALRICFLIVADVEAIMAKGRRWLYILRSWGHVALLVGKGGCEENAVGIWFWCGSLSLGEIEVAEWLRHGRKGLWKENKEHSCWCEFFSFHYVFDIEAVEWLRRARGDVKPTGSLKNMFWLAFGNIGMVKKRWREEKKPHLLAFPISQLDRNCRVVGG